MFRDIWQCREDSRMSTWISNMMFKWKIGDGMSIKFWKDMWFNNIEVKSSFSRLYSLAVDKDISVAEMKKRWHEDHDLIWRRTLRGWEIDSKQELGILINQIKLEHKADSMVWMGNTGVFNSIDLYHLLDQNNTVPGIWYHFWKLKLPSRIKLFVWKLMNQSLTVKTFLKVRIQGIEVQCSLCQNGEESQFHLF